MANDKGGLPPTMISSETGRTLVRGVRPMEISYKGASMIVDLPGYYAIDGGVEDGVLVGDDMKAADEALGILKAKMDGAGTLQPSTEPARRRAG